MTETPVRLADREAIREVMARYARGVDRADWDLVRSTYHHDAYDDHGDYKGNIDGFIAFATQRTGGTTQCMHFLGQSMIEFGGEDVAVVETHFMTAHTLGPKAQKEYAAGDGSKPVQLTSYGRYADRMERRDGVWRIARRFVIFEATRTYCEDAPPIKPEWAQQRRDKEDPIFQLRREAGIRG